MKKYLCIGSMVVSVTDGDIHYVNAYRVAELYGVPLHECVFMEETDSIPPGYDGTLRILRPDPTGIYNVR